MTAHLKSFPTREMGDGRGAGGSDPAQIQKKTLLPCEVNGIKSQALLDTGVEATVISEDLYYKANTCVSKLEPTKKPDWGAKSMPLNVVGKTGVTIQLGGIRAHDKVLFFCGLLQQVLNGIDFLTAHKCILILTLTLSTVRGDPGRWSSETLIECTGSLWLTLLRYLQIWSQTYPVSSGGE